MAIVYLNYYTEKNLPKAFRATLSGHKNNIVFRKSPRKEDSILGVLQTLTCCKISFI